MPCWTVSQTTLDLTSLNVNIDTLKKTLEKAGYTVYQNNHLLTWYNGSYNHSTGQLKTRDNMDWIKKAYPKQLIRDKARRFGWQLKELGGNEFEVIKQ